MPWALVLDFIKKNPQLLNAAYGFITGIIKKARAGPEPVPGLMTEAQMSALATTVWVSDEQFNDAWQLANLKPPTP